MIRDLLLISLLTSVPLHNALAEDSDALYGPPRVENFASPNRHIVSKNPVIFNVLILPWQEAPGMTLDEQMQRVLDHPPGNVEYTLNMPPILKALSKDMAKSNSIFLKADEKFPGVAVAFACNYRGRKKYYREIVFFNEMLGFHAKGKTSVSKQLEEHSRNICKEDPQKLKRDAVRALVTTEPGEGDGAERLAKAAYSWNAGLGGAGTFQIWEWTTLLFDDGWARRSSEIPLTELDIDASRKYEPEDWFQWRENEDGEVEINRKRGGKAHWHKIQGDPKFLDAAEKGTRYSGHFDFHHTTGGAFIGTTTQHETFTMRKDGTYSTSSSRMISSQISGGTVNSISTNSETGCSSAVAIIGGGLVGGGGKTDTACGDGRSGTYEIDGFVITLAADNGVIKRFPFYARSEKQFYMHGRMFSFAKDVE